MNRTSAAASNLRSSAMSAMSLEECAGLPPAPTSQLPAGL